MPRFVLTTVLTVGILTLGAAEPREQEIAALEKQIAELNKKLEELKKAPVGPKSANEPALPDSWAKTMKWRSIGPCSMGGRITAISVFEADPTTYYVATASGGLLKTTNNGTTFEHQFDREATVSIGDVAVAPSNKDIVYVGTGEGNPRNSVSYGDGVYKSTDGGKTWTNVGLKKTFQIGRVIVHPTNPDIVYVGALGRLYGPNEDRGVYKTVDGGKTWKKVLYVDDRTGIIEMKIHPTEPDTLLVATWERERDGFDSHAGAMTGRGPGAGGASEPALPDGYDAYDPVRKWGKGTGIHKTTDGGKTWKKITKGLPTCEMGRIGLDYYHKNPNIVYAVIDSAKIGMGKVSGYLGVTTEAVKEGVKIDAVTENSPAEKAGLKAGDVVLSIDGKALKGSEAMAAAMAQAKPGDKVKMELTRDGKPIKLEVTLGERPQPGGGGGRRGGLDFKVEETKDGLKVLAMLPQGRAATAGLMAEDLIFAVDGKAVKTSAELADALRGRTQAAKLSVVRGKEKKELTYAAGPAAPRPAARPYSAWLGGQRENVQDSQGTDGIDTGGIYRSADGGETWTRVNSLNPRPMYFSQVRVDPSNDQNVYVLGVKFHVSTNGGKTFATQTPPVHDDLHALWINPRDGRHLVLGTDGGTYVSYDRGAKWDYLNNMALGQFYHVCVDDRKPYNVYGGLQDNGSWGGPSMALDGRGPINADWMLISGGDGFVCRVDPADNDVVYYESQDGNIGRRNIRTGERGFIKPQAKGETVRFNWNTPFIVSSHNPKVLYCAGNKVFRSIKRGDDPKAISPELCKNGKASATALSESPLNPDVLWVGTDDGQLWVTRDGGAKWDNVTAKVGLPKPYWVSTIDASRFAEGRAYVCFDAHRSDNDDPHVYVTEDYGATWKPLRANLPMGSSRCLREDLYNRDVLYLGTEFAVWASIDRGASWTKINGNLPTVAVHELAQHPTAGEMVAATHGRSLWILDVTPLRQLTPAIAKDGAKLLQPGTAVRWRNEPQRGTIYGPGNRDFFGENPAAGAHVFYTLAKKASKVSLEIQDVTGKSIASLPSVTTPGLHRATWNLRGVGGPPLGMGLFVPSRLVGAAGRAAQSAPVGVYRVVLKVDGTEQVQALRVENDPTLPQGVTPIDVEIVRKKRLHED